MAATHWHTIRTPETVITLLNPRRPVTGAECSQAGCAGGEVYRCAYRDREGRRCASHWCEEHSVKLGGAHFCRRHAAVMRILVPTQGTLVEMKMLPLVDDRALVLADLLFSGISDRILDLLRERFKDEPHVYFAADLVPRAHTPRLGRASWERGWTCYDHRGYRTRVCVRVPVRTSIVQLVLNDVPVTTVQAPRRGAEREEFQAALVAELRSALFTADDEDSDDLPEVVAGGHRPPQVEARAMAFEEARS